MELMKKQIKRTIENTKDEDKVLFLEGLRNYL